MPLSQKTMTSKVIGLKNKIESRKATVFAVLQRRTPLLLFLCWIACGTLFYNMYEAYPLHVALAGRLAGNNC